MIHLSTSVYPHELWFTSDLHLGHERILTQGSSDRPFETIEKHDELLVSRWNEVVQPHHRMFFLGDLGWFRTRHRERITQMACRLHGAITWVDGNHDFDIPDEVKHHFGDVRYQRIGLTVKTVGRKANPNDKLYIVLDHFPGLTWDKRHAGALNLFGHEHGRYDRHLLPRSLDVGVDSMRYRPVNLGQVLTILGITQDYVVTPPPGTFHLPDQYTPLGETRRGQFAALPRTYHSVEKR